MAGGLPPSDVEALRFMGRAYRSVPFTTHKRDSAAVDEWLREFLSAEEVGRLCKACGSWLGRRANARDRELQGDARARGKHLSLGEMTRLISQP